MISGVNKKTLFVALICVLAAVARSECSEIEEDSEQLDSSELFLSEKDFGDEWGKSETLLEFIVVGFSRRITNAFDRACQRGHEKLCIHERQTIAFFRSLFLMARIVMGKKSVPEIIDHGYALCTDYAHFYENVSDEPDDASSNGEVSSNDMLLDGFRRAVKKQCKTLKRAYNFKYYAGYVVDVDKIISFFSN